LLLALQDDFFGAGLVGFALHDQSHRLPFVNEGPGRLESLLGDRDLNHLAGLFLVFCASPHHY